MDDDPEHRRRLLPLPGPHGPNTKQWTTFRPPVPSPSIATDVSSPSLRRLPHTLVLPPAHPASVAARSVPGLGYYRVPPPPPPASGDVGSHHPRPLSQFLSMDFLFRPPYTDLVAPPSIALSPPLRPRSGSDRVASGLPPRGAGHQRSQSDVPLRFASQSNLQMPPPAPVDAEALVAANNSTLDGILGAYGAYMNPNGPQGAVGPSVPVAQELRDQPDSQAPAWSPADSSENEAESSNGSLPRHCRSLSADSLVGKFTFGPAGLEPSSSNLPPPSPAPVVSGRLARSGSGSIGGAAALFAKEFANSKEFSEADKKVIMESEHLAQMVLTDPKRVRRILNNRLSAAKSKERKVKYITELEAKIKVLQGEAMNLSAQVKMVKKDQAQLTIHNHEIKIRLDALQQQAQLKDALNEALESEVQRLKLFIGETSNPHMLHGSDQQLSSQMIQLHQLQILRQPSQLEQVQQRHRNF